MNRAPRQVWLFSGHMMDAPGRAAPRFAPSMEAAAAAQIAAALAAAGAGPQDWAYSQAAAGGDLLFLEACAARGVRSRVLLPFAEAEFAQQSILPSQHGAQWLARWQTLKTAGHIETIDLMPEHLGPTPADADPFSRCNLWLLNSALAAAGPAPLRFICLWNGAGGDGPGGTRHMMEQVRAHSPHITWIDTRQLVC